MHRMITPIGMWLVLSTQVLAGTLYVNASATGLGDGASWANAQVDLSAAVSAANSGDELWVAAGTYGPIVLKSGVRVYGGFNGTETAPSQSDPDVNVTIISGGGTSRPVMSVGNDSTTVLRGFRITEGFIDFPIIGGPDTGGGLYLKNSGVQITRCVFSSNRSATMGGALAVWGGAPSFVNCKFYDNEADLAAGAVWNGNGATPTFVNCLFYDNRAMEAGAVSSLTGGPSFTNCTFTDNHASKGVAGAIFDVPGDVVLRNCIFWDNKAAKLGTDALFNLPAAGGTTAATYSNIKGGWSGEGNKDVDPLFVNAAARDYRLQSNSLCRDAGNTALLPKDSADLDWDGVTTSTLGKDLEMKSRVSGTAVDIGAYESTGP